MNIIAQIYERYLRHTKAIEYWRKKGAKIGECCEIYPTANLGSEPYLIVIGNHVRINSGVQLITHDGGVWILRNSTKVLNAPSIDLFGQIKIGNNVHIGTCAMIMPRCSIGNNCIIGCGAIVTKDIPDNSVAVGVPARVIENIEEYYEKHKGEFDYTKKMDVDSKKEYLLKKYNL